MAPSKNVTEVPRSILPRLTWNGSSPRTTVTPPQPSALSRKRQQKRQQHVQGWYPARHQLHTLTFSPRSSPFFTTPQDTNSTSTIARRSSTSSHTTSYRPSVEPLSNPVRYNGVYVAVFKSARRAFHASAARERDHHFDTLKFVQRLKDEGFSEEQAVAMMRVLNDVIQESIQNLTRTMVLKEG